MDAQTTLTLRCTACGSLTDAKCVCGAPYTYLSPSQQVERRREKAAELYQKGSTMEQIATQLGVVVQTISNDLANFPKNGKLKPTKTVSNPKGAGRPKGSKRTPNPALKARNEKIVALANEGISPREIAAEVGLVQRGVHQLLEHERIRIEAFAELLGAAAAKNFLEKGILRIEDAIRIHAARLDKQFEQRVVAEVTRRFDKAFPTLQKEQNEAFEREQTYREYLRKAKKTYTLQDYNTILMCLHPDGERSEQKLTEAFRLFRAMKFALTGEK